MHLQYDKLGIPLGLTLAATLALPFVVYSPNRIAAGQSLSLSASLPLHLLAVTLCLILGTAAVSIYCQRPILRLASSIISLLGLVFALGYAAQDLVVAGGPYGRVAAGPGFWLSTFILSILLADAIVRMKPHPLTRLLIFLLAGGMLGFLLISGRLDALSVMQEYDNRATAFWREAGHHLQLAFGSLAMAISVGVPLGIALQRHPKAKAYILNSLSLLQTIPSMALFGILIAPLGWFAAHSTWAYDLGIRGIGMPPAFIALFLYSLLPVVANTSAGLTGVPNGVTEAATGMGMTSRQRLIRIELPLAIPVILTGIRIVLVQNIGLATIAALIGGGGFGVFVFQGLGQTATDLILLGALPTVALAFAASITLNVLIELLRHATVREGYTP